MEAAGIEPASEVAQRANREGSLTSTVTWFSTPLPAPRELAWWELYGPDNWSQANDLSADEPDKL